MGPADKKRHREERLKERFDFEKGREGGYELIYPMPGDDERSSEGNRKYDMYIKKANDLWDEFTTGRKSVKEYDLDGKDKPKGNRNINH